MNQDVKQASETTVQGLLKAFRLLDTDQNNSIDSSAYFDKIAEVTDDPGDKVAFDELLYGTDVDNESNVTLVDFIGTLVASKSQTPDEMAQILSVFDQ